MLNLRIGAGLMAIVVLLSYASLQARSREHLVFQAGRTFSESSLTVYVGDMLYFMNNDDVPHNVTSTSNGNEFDLGEQAPGIATPVSFTEPGKVNIECLMHPRMTMTVEVIR